MKFLIRIAAACLVIQFHLMFALMMDWIHLLEPGLPIRNSVWNTVYCVNWYVFCVSAFAALCLKAKEEFKEIEK